MIKNLSLVFDTKINGRSNEKDILQRQTDLCNKVLDIYVSLAQNIDKWTEPTRVEFMKVMLGIADYVFTQSTGSSTTERSLGRELANRLSDVRKKIKSNQINGKN